MKVANRTPHKLNYVPSEPPRTLSNGPGGSGGATECLAREQSKHVTTLVNAVLN